MADEHADHHLGELTAGQGPTAIEWTEIRNAIWSSPLPIEVFIEDILNSISASDPARKTH